MLRGTRDDHVRWLIAWFRNLGGADLRAEVARDGVRPPGCEVVEVRAREEVRGRHRLLATVELDGLEARVSYVVAGYEGLVRAGIARLHEALGGKP